MGADSSFTAAPRFRQRKISLKQQLRILWERNLSPNVEDVRGDLLGIVETGVDKSEEDERHLQAVLSAATVSGRSKDAYIPTPKATMKWEEYSKYYKPGWSETESYIRSSATVEDAQGNEYNMDEEDLECLNEINSKIEEPKAKCCEDEFELICSLTEAVIAEKQPFLSTDPEQLLSYEELEKHIFKKLEDRRQAASNPLDPERLLLEAQSPDYAPKYAGSPNRSLTASVKTFGRSIYEHWRKRKIARGGKSIFPTLKHESGLSSDDSDPYVTFRHREVRHSRKTRRTDQQNSGRLRKLHSEMQGAQSIFELILKRERKRLQQIQTDFEVFELRCRVKALKRKLNVGAEPDDVELLVSVPKRVRQEEQARLRREEAERQRKTQLAKEKQERDRERREANKEAQKEAASREARQSASAAASAASEARKSTAALATGSRIPDLGHVTVEQQLAERNAALEMAVAEKIRQRQEAEKGWINATDNPNVPYIDLFDSPSNLLSPPYISGYGTSEDSKMDIDSDELQEKPAHSAGGKTRPPSSTPWSSVDSLRGSNAENANAEDKRLQLPLVSIGEEDSPEIIQCDRFSHEVSEGDENSAAPTPPARYNDVDFMRFPTAFSVPTNFPHAFCRRREFRSVTCIDRILPTSANPLCTFGEKLKSSTLDQDERLADRFRFDHDADDTVETLATLRDDPAKLNGIDPVTQNLRFSAMLTAKAGELLADAQAQRRRAIQAMIKRQQLQQQQRAAAEAQAQSQQNAQLQTQNNLRLQQGQRALQRQQERKKSASAGDAKQGSAKPAGKDGSSAADNAANSATGGAPKQQPPQQQQQPKKQAANAAASAHASNAGAANASKYAKPPVSANGNQKPESPSNSQNTATPSKPTTPNLAKPNAAVSSPHKNELNDKKSAGNLSNGQRDSSADRNNGGHMDKESQLGGSAKDGNVTPQLPKVEASV